MLEPQEGAGKVSMAVWFAWNDRLRPLWRVFGSIARDWTEQ